LPGKAVMVLRHSQHHHRLNFLKGTNMADDFSLFERLFTNDRSTTMAKPVTRNYNELLGGVLLKQHPEWFDQSEEAVNAAANKATKAAIELRALNDKSRKVDPRGDYNKLRHQLFTLRENVKNSDIYLADKSNSVKHFEERINSLLRMKKKADEEGALGQVRALDNQIVNLEGELADARKEFTRATKQSANAARALSSFDGYEKIKQLKAQLAA
jgi:hypothetical protein